MPPLPPYNIYREQLTSLFHGHALWEPDPSNVYAQVSVGDVGYVKEGFFTRMFNVLLEWNDPSNYVLCEPEPYERLDLGPFVNVRDSRFTKGDYYSRYVTPSLETSNVMATSPDDSAGTTYSCRRKQGALLALPKDGLRKDVIRTKVFEDYIRDHIDSWYAFAQARRLDVERMEDLILVTGCTLVSSWGVAAFVDTNQDAEIMLRLHGTFFDWQEIRPNVAYRNSVPQNQYQNQCVFIRGFRARRVFLWTRLKGAADPLPDDPDNTREDEIQVTRVPDVPSYRDPLTGVLDYLAEKCPDDTVVIAHDDDLQLVEQVVRSRFVLHYYPQRRPVMRTFRKRLLRMLWRRFCFKMRLAYLLRTARQSYTMRRRRLFSTRKRLSSTRQPNSKERWSRSSCILYCPSIFSNSISPINRLNTTTISRAKK
ncbi:hypothetical protein BJV77DRAFT_560962 [Russula vinacea]|nr:hypothetical protein BJV77DRAFT_560962 [Russula vinacea]